MSRERQLLAASVTRAVNRVPAARLVYADGSASASDFTLSNEASFAPGSEVEVLVGPDNDAVSIFKGVVVKHAIRIRERGPSQLVVECRHRAFRLTVGRRSACFNERTDSDVIAAILDAAGLDGDVADTATPHAQLVQFDATDWDFLVARAEANGRVVLTRGDVVEVRAPAGGTPVATLLFGASMLEFDAEIDARAQYAAVHGVTWDAARQELVAREAEAPSVASPGNLSGDDLAAVAGREYVALRHVAISEDEAQAWADGAQLKSRLSRVSGRVKCEGISAVGPGDVITLAGVGERFSGDTYVTAVRHDLDPTQGWKTHIQFGGVDRWITQEADASAPRAGALVPGVHGLQIGKVVGNEDPDGEHRVRVQMPLLDEAGDGAWARVACLDAGEDRGVFVRPELGDEVVLGFLQGDPRAPVVLGMLHSSARGAPLAGSDDNHEKVFQTRSGMRVYFNDDTKVMRLETPAGNRVVLSEEDGGVSIEDQHGNRIATGSDGITVESVGALTLKGNGAVELSGPATTTVKGSSVELGP